MMGAQAIKLDPSCYLGHEMKHAALHGTGRYGEAVKAFATMLSKLDESPDVNIRRQSFPQYFRKPRVD